MPISIFILSIKEQNSYHITLQSYEKEKPVKLEVTKVYRYTVWYHQITVNQTLLDIDSLQALKIKGLQSMTTGTPW